ncbi:MAG: uracil-DNA glycosylase [Sphingomonas adhaesiva]|uniref:uracil-DNA glycosylase family protein n=1 Tax=Sphingomonas adhaesiva TaxID=28212 RepID=UPI002FF73595
MGADQNLDWAAAAASALDWWHDAGVDVLVEDERFDWLAAPVAHSIPQHPAPAPDAAPAPAAMPDSWDAFVAWRTGDTAPEAKWGGAAIAASGAAGADLLFFVDCPERGDRETLMEGEVGRLFDRMLAAIGRSRADVAIASVCTRRPTTGRVPREIEERLADIARHHVALARPKRVMAMGDAATRALLATNVAEARGRLQPLNHKNATIAEVVATHHPRFLLDRPAAKAEAWRDLLMLTGTERT